MRKIIVPPLAAGSLGVPAPRALAGNSGTPLGRATSRVDRLRARSSPIAMPREANQSCLQQQRHPRKRRRTMSLSTLRQIVDRRAQPGRASPHTTNGAFR